MRLFDDLSDLSEMFGQFLSIPAFSFLAYKPNTAISEELFFSSVHDNFHPVSSDKSDHGSGSGGGFPLGILSNPLSVDHLSEPRVTGSPSASVGSSSAYSRNSGSVRRGSKEQHEG